MHSKPAANQTRSRANGDDDDGDNEHHEVKEFNLTCIRISGNCVMAHNTPFRSIRSWEQ